MASSRGIRAGRAYVEIGADDSQLQRKLAMVGQSLKKVGGIMAGAGAGMIASGAAITGTLTAAAFSAASVGDELAKMSDRTGTTVEALSELKHAGEQSDVAFDSIGKSLQKMQRNLIEAADGNKTAADSFDKLGLSISDLRSISPDQQFEAIADSISKIQEPAARTAAAMDVFGKSGADLMPLMLGGAEGIRALREEAKALGLQVSGEDAAAAVLFGDTWANLQKVLKDVWTEIGFAMLPVLTEITSVITPIVKRVASFINENRVLVLSVAAVGAGLTAAGTILTGVGGVLAAAGVAVAGFTTVMGALASPVGLVVAGVAGLVAYLTAAGVAFFAMTESGRFAVKWFKDGFTEALAIAEKTIGGIFDAIKGGNFQLAGEIAFTGLKLAMAEAMDAVAKAFGASLKSMIYGLSIFIHEIRNAMARTMEIAAILQRATGQNTLANVITATAKELRSQALFDPKQFNMDVQGSLDPENIRRELDKLNEEASRKPEGETSPAQETVAQPAETIDGSAVGNLAAQLADRFAGGASSGIGSLSRLTMRGAGFLSDAATKMKDLLAESAEATRKRLEPARAGTQDAMDRQQFGTFSASQAAMYGGGGFETLQREANALLRNIERHSRKNQPLVAGP